MSDRHDLTLDVSVETKAARDVVRSLTKDLERLKRAATSFTKSSIAPFAATGTASPAKAYARQQSDNLKRMRDTFRFEDRMRRQRTREDRSASADLRQRLGFEMRMTRQRLAEEKAGASERSQAARRERQEEREHHRQVARIRSSFSDAGQGFSRASRVPAVAGVASMVGAAAGARRILANEALVDASEINARIYGSLTKDAARQLRENWAAPLSVTLGSTTKALIDSYVEALKVGIPDVGAKGFAQLATQTSEAWSIQMDDVVETLGIINTTLMSSGAAFSLDKLKSTANAINFLSAKMATSPTKMISAFQKGIGGGQILGMSPESTAGFLAASTSLGNEAHSSGRLLDYIASRIVELPRLSRKQGEDGTESRRFASSLYGGVAAFEKARRDNPDDFVFDMLERLSKVKDKKKQEEMTRWLLGREWLGEGGRMISGIGTVKEAQKLAKESKDVDSIGETWQLHVTKLAFIFKQFRAGFLNILGELGIALSPLAQQAAQYFTRWAETFRNGDLRQRFSALLEGFIEGLGFKDLPELLEGVFGIPGANVAEGVERWKAFARGLGQGIRAVAEAVVAGIQAMSGAAGDPEALGRWVAKIVGWAVVLKAASPAIDIITGLASAIGALAAAAVALKVGGVVAVISALAGALGLLTALNWESLKKTILSPGWLGPDSERYRGKKTLEELYPWHRSSMDGSASSSSMIRKASFEGTVDRLSDRVDRLGGLIQRASFSGDGGSSFAGGSGSGGSSSGSGGGSSAGGNPARSYEGNRSGSSLPNVGGFGRIGRGAPNLDGAKVPNPLIAPGTGTNAARLIEAGPGRQSDASNPIKGFANLMRGQYGAAGSNLTTITTPSGRKVMVHSEAAEAFKGFIGDLEATGYKIGSIGGYANRGQANGSGRISQHGYGNAIDINPGANPYMTSKTDMPKNISDMAAKWGLTWGGDWSSKYRDPMHFEWTGIRPWLDKNGKPKLGPDNRPSGPGMPFGLTPEKMEAIQRARGMISPELATRLGDGSMTGGAVMKGSGGFIPRSWSGSDIVRSLPAEVGMSNRNAPVSSSVQAPITVQGGGHDPEVIANKVQQRLQEVMNTRSHDISVA